MEKSLSNKVDMYSWANIYIYIYIYIYMYIYIYICIILFLPYTTYFISVCSVYLFFVINILIIKTVFVSLGLQENEEQYLKYLLFFHCGKRNYLFGLFWIYDIYSYNQANIFSYLCVWICKLNMYFNYRNYYFFYEFLVPFSKIRK